VKEFLSLFLGAIVFVITIAARLIIWAWLGYGFGFLLQLGTGDTLEGVFGISASDVPKVLAWITLASSMAAVLINGGARREETD
jgi:hypothetical protein